MDAVNTARKEVRREDGILCRLQEEEVKEKNRKEPEIFSKRPRNSKMGI